MGREGVAKCVPPLCSQPPSFIPCIHLLIEVPGEKKSEVLQLENEENLLVLLHTIAKLPLWIGFALHDLLLCVLLVKFNLEVTEKILS